MKALAHACGMSAPALYRYFPSKLEFALYPLGEADDNCRYLLSQAAAAPADPLHRMRATLDAALTHVDNVVVAMSLALEAGHAEPNAFSPDRLLAFESTLSEALVTCVPELGSRATDLAHTLMSLVLAAGATSGELAHEGMQRQAVPIVRGYLIDAGVNMARFDDVFSLAAVS